MLGGVQIPQTMKKAEDEEKGESKQEESKPKQQQGGVFDKIIDNVVTYLSEELGARLSKDIVDAVEPELKEALINMVREGKVKIEITGGELLKGNEEATEEAG